MSTGGDEKYNNMKSEAIMKALEGANDATGEQMKETLEMITGAVKKGIDPKEMLSINDETMEGMYAQAYMLYNQGKYKDALNLFMILMMLSQHEPKYMMGSGACLHHLGKYEKAAQIYMACWSVDQQDPMPQFHAADCYIKLKALPLADLSLRYCIEACGGKKQYELVKERAKLMHDTVMQELKEMGVPTQEEIQSS